jgi:hypothetical protein
MLERPPGHCQIYHLGLCRTQISASNEPSHRAPCHEQPALSQVPLLNLTSSRDSCKTLGHLPAPGICPDCIMLAFCSWNLWPSLSVLFMNLSTHLITHPSSFACKDLVVKSFTQSSKHRCTRFEYVYSICKLNPSMETVFRGAWLCS